MSVVTVNWYEYFFIITAEQTNSFNVTFFLNTLVTLNINYTAYSIYNI